MGLYQKHRPKEFKDVIGQPKAVKTLEKLFDRGSFPHAILLAGQSGTGKTTIGRIIRRKLDCSKNDFQEINCADFRGIDTIREIRDTMTLAPLGGKCRVWLIDESHRLTGDAQSALLKALEDTPDHVYFLLATTDPQKLLKTIITRCTEIRLSPIPDADLKNLLVSVSEKEGFKISPEVFDRIIESSDGSARKSLVLLEQIAGLESDSERLEAVLKSDTKRQSIDLARALLNPRSDWKSVAKILSEIEDEAENVRHLILAYARKVLLNGSGIAPRAYVIISCFEGNFWDSKAAGLARACYEVFSQK